MSDEQQKQLLTIMIKDSAPGSVVHTLFRSRIIKLWMKRFAREIIQEQDMTGLVFHKCVIERIQETCNLALRIHEISMRVHTKHYNRIFEEIAKTKEF